MPGGQAGATGGLGSCCGLTQAAAMRGERPFCTPMITWPVTHQPVWLRSPWKQQAWQRPCDVEIFLL